MNSLASILYSSSTVKTKKRKNLSLKPISKLYGNSSKCKPTTGSLFRSSTPKTLLTSQARPIVSDVSSPTDANYSSESPRCSTPLLSKQRRTRPFIACELCRQRAFQSLSEQENKIEKPHLHHSHIRSTTLYQQQNQSTAKACRRRSSIAQLLVWIV